MSNHQSNEPLVSPQESPREITFRVIVLAILLTIVLAAANAYLGLKVGATVSASIPAAVIALGFFRMMKNASLLESVMVQTAASVGEGLIAGISFIMPALLVLHYWQGFNYWQTLTVGLIGGVLGVLFSIPIRRVLLNNPELRFPEGVAIGSIFKASLADERADLHLLLLGGLIGSLISLFQTGFRVLADGFAYWWRVHGTLVGAGGGFSPALIAAGYIVGLNVGMSVFVGVVIGWLLGVPLLALTFGIPHASNVVDAANSLWSTHIRYLGVGTMLVGGLWTFIYLFKPVMVSLIASFKNHSGVKGATGNILRTERDIPLPWVVVLLLLLSVPILIFVFSITSSHSLALSLALRLCITVCSLLYVLLVGFAFSTISAYFAGLIGSSNSPGSGLIVSVLLVFSLFLVAIMSIETTFHLHATRHELVAAALAILVTSLISSSLVIANETIQDLKVGQIVGATPWKQQVMLLLGVVVAALVIPPILELLFRAYGMAGVFPRPGMDPTQMLAAPQAGLMAAIAQGAFTHHLPWGMIGIGGLVAVVGIVIDEYLKPYGKRLPVLAIGLGIYLPLTASIPVVMGGVLSYLVHRRIDHGLQVEEEKGVRMKHRGLTLACGLVAGSSLMGVVLAIPFAIKQNSNALSLVGPAFTPYSVALGAIVTFSLCLWIYRKVTRVRGS